MEEILNLYDNFCICVLMEYILQTAKLPIVTIQWHLVICFIFVYLLLWLCSFFFTFFVLSKYFLVFSLLLLCWFFFFFFLLYHLTHLITNCSRDYSMNHDLPNIIPNYTNLILIKKHSLIQDIFLPQLSVTIIVKYIHIC